MISPKRKILFTLGGLGLVVICLVVFGISPFLKAVKENAEDFIRQKEALNMLDSQILSLEDFQKKYPVYQQYLARIKNSFIDPEAPINFLEFLEDQAEAMGLAVNITPLFTAPTKTDTWLSMEFSVGLTGDFQECLRFLERLEHSPWLIEIAKLDITKGSGGKVGVGASKYSSGGDVSCNFPIKAFSSEVPLE